jgi:5-methylcytosine-specific restriction endonuclease McrA
VAIPSPVLKVASSAAEMYFVPTLLEDVERRELRLKARAAVLAALDSLGGEAAREALLERALADGGFTPRELAAGPPEAAAASYHSLVAHQLSWALTNLKRDGLVDNPRRAVWRLAGAALETVPLAVEAETGPDRLVELRTMPYREYLRTPEWRRARAAALLRAGHCCSLDVTHTQNLEVHHRTYERLGAELASDLVVLCESCHRLHHKEHGRPRRTRPTPDCRLQSVAPPSPPAAPRARQSFLQRLLAR